MNPGEFFTIDRFRDGDVKKYKCLRLCFRHITVVSVEDEKDKWSMPWDRLKDINPPVKRFVDDLINKP